MPSSKSANRNSAASEAHEFVSACIRTKTKRISLKEIEIEARGMKFQTLADGPEEGPLLLLLHGLPRNRWEWHHQIPAMAKMGFRVVAPDLRGFCPGVPREGVRAGHRVPAVNETIPTDERIRDSNRSKHPRLPGDADHRQRR